MSPRKHPEAPGCLGQRVAWACARELAWLLAWSQSMPRVSAAASTATGTAALSRLCGLHSWYGRKRLACWTGPDGAAAAGCGLTCGLIFGLSCGLTCGLTS